MGSDDDLVLDSESNDDDSGERTRQRIEEIVEAHLAKLRQGEFSDLDEIIAKHEELAPQLEERLRFYQNVYRAIASLADDAPESEGGSSSVGSEAKAASDVRSVSPQFPDDNAALRVSCPHCGNKLQVVGKEVEELTCGSCGSAVKVDPNATLSFDSRDRPTVIGRFQIQRVLGQGGFGTVYRAYDPRLGRQVAVKVPRQGYFATEEEEQRFLREARNVSQLRHPNIVRVYEVSDSERLPFIVSEYIDGLTLGDLVSSGSLGFSECAKLMIQVAEAVEYAHRNSIVHRDLKPSNILVDRDNTAFVADFGLARREDAEITMTLDGAILGTPAYMSPEQAAGHQDAVDSRSDVYSLGVVLYRLLCKELPFHGTQRMLIHQVIHDDPKPPHKLNEHIPRDLETITLKAMAKVRSERYQSAQEFADELRRWMRSEPILARPISRLNRTWRLCRRYPLVSSLVATIALMLACGTLLASVWAVRESRLRGEASKNARDAIASRLQSDALLLENVTANGMVAMRDNDLTQALLWHARAQSMEDSVAVRIRLGMLQDRCPKLTSLWATESPVTDLQFDGTGSRLIVGCTDGVVAMFEIGRTDAVFSQRLFDGMVRDVRIDDQARFGVAMGEGNDALLLDADDGHVISQLSHDDMVTCVDLSPNSQLAVSGGRDSHVRLWQTSTGEPFRAFEFEGEHITTARFFPGGERIAVVSLDDSFVYRIRILDIESGAVVGQGMSHDEHVGDLAISQDGNRMVTGGNDGSIKLWDVPNSVLLAEHEAAAAICKVVLLEQEQLIVSVAVNGDVDHWPITAGVETPEPQRMGLPIYAATGDSLNHFIALGATNGEVYVRWRESGIDASCRIRNGTTVTSLAVHPNDRQIAVGGNLGVVQIWDLAGCAPTRTLLAHGSPVRNALFSYDGERCYTVENAGIARIWNAKTGALISDELRHDIGITQCALSNNGRLFATAGMDNFVRVWDAFTGAPIGPPLPHDSPVTKVAFSPNNNLLISGTDLGTVKAWVPSASPSSNPQPKFVAQHSGRIRDIAFDAEGEFVATASMDGTARCWELQTGLPTTAPMEHAGFVSCCQFVEGRRLLLTGSSDGDANLWSISDQPEIVERLGCDGEITSARYHPDTGRIVTTDLSGDTIIWIERTGSFRVERKISSRMIPSMYHADLTDSGQIIASCGGTIGLPDSEYGNGASLIAELTNGRLLSPPLLHSGPIRWIRFDPSAGRLVTASADSWAVIWDIRRLKLPGDDLQRYSQLVAQVDFSSGQLQPMSPVKQVSEFAFLSKTHPDLFVCDDTEIDQWTDLSTYLRLDR